MRSTLPPQPYTVELPQVFPSSSGEHHPAMAGPEPEQPKVFITGDIRMCITWQEAALRPITGNYSIETVGMQEPLYALWHSEGQVSSRQARSTNITFDARGVRVGETQTYLVAVQVIEGGSRGRAVQSGMFVQVEVTGDESGAA
jgi:hypothetical protein